MKYVQSYCQWRRSGVFIVNFEHFTPCASVSIVNFVHVIADWVMINSYHDTALFLYRMKYQRAQGFFIFLRGTERHQQQEIG